MWPKAAIVGLCLATASAYGAPTMRYTANFQRTDDSPQFHVYTAVLNTPRIEWSLYQGTNSYSPTNGWGGYLRYGKSASDPLATVGGTITGSTLVIVALTNDFPVPADGWYAAVVLTNSTGAVSALGLITVRPSPEISAPGILSKTYAINGSEYGPFSGDFSGWPFYVEGTIGEAITNAINEASIAPDDWASYPASGDVDMQTNAIELVSSLQFSGGTGDQGTLSWNTDEETLDLIQNGAVLQIGQEHQKHVRADGIAITNGQVVYRSGTIGNSGRIKVKPYIANGSISASLISGVATEDFADGEDGKVTVFGKVRGIQVPFAENSVLYASPSVAGGLTATMPTGTNIAVEIASVITSNGANGTLDVCVRHDDKNAALTASAIENSGLANVSVLASGAVQATSSIYTQTVALAAGAVQATSTTYTQTVALAAGAVQSAATAYTQAIALASSAVQPSSLPNLAPLSNAVSAASATGTAAHAFAVAASVLASGAVQATSSTYTQTVALAAGSAQQGGDITGRWFAAGNYTEYATNGNEWIGGGGGNLATGTYSGVAAGNVNQARGGYSFICGGSANQAVGSYSLVGVGSGNQAVGSYSLVGGGSANKAHESYSSVFGGWANIASGTYASVLGGFNNYATTNALAAGIGAKATNSGAFVFSGPGTTNATFGSQGDNTFNVKAIGGIYMLAPNLMIQDTNGATVARFSSTNSVINGELTLPSYATTTMLYGAAASLSNSIAYLGVQVTGTQSVASNAYTMAGAAQAYASNITASGWSGYTATQAVNAGGYAVTNVPYIRLIASTNTPTLQGSLYCDSSGKPFFRYTDSYGYQLATVNELSQYQSINGTLTMLTDKIWTWSGFIRPATATNTGARGQAFTTNGYLVWWDQDMSRWLWVQGNTNAFPW